MKAWEFLIQKEGDRAWLPLETPSVEVLEGRYQLVIRSECPQIPIEINLTYQADSSDKTQVQTRNHQTNKEGLMVVFPYTYLKAGLWEIACIARLPNQESGQYSVSIEALSLDEEEDEEDSFYEENADLPSDRAESSDSPDSTVVEESEVEELEVEESELEQAELEQADSVDEETSPDVEQPDQPEEPEAYDSSFFDVPSPPEVSKTLPLEQQTLEGVDLSSVELILDRTMVLAEDNGKITLTGVLRSDRRLVFPQQIGLQLTILLQNPQNLELIQEIKHLLILQSLPVPFEYSFDLLPQTQLSFILAEAQIFDSWSISDDRPQSALTPLTQAQFSITTGIDRLMEAIANQRDTEETPHPTPPILPFPLTAEQADFSPPTSSPKPPVVNLDLFNLAKQQPTETNPTQPFQTSVSPSLPPQLSPSTAASQPKYLRLPSFNGTPSSPPATDLPLLPGTPKPPKPKEELTLPPLNLNPSSSPAPLPKLEEKPDPSPVDRAFESLHLQDKFSDRLNDLAKEAEDWVEENPQSTDLESIEHRERQEDDEVIDAEFVEEVSPADLQADLQTDLQLEPASGTPLLLAPGKDEEEDSQEVVLDRSDRSLTPTEDNSSSAQPPLQRLTTPIPTPQIESPERDWIAEETITLQVGLATRSPNIHIKYWLVDAQTRMLLEEPRWIVDLMPDGLHYRSANLSLTVPQGTMELQFEAIAVEIATQRESHKTTFRRLVLPPNLPELTFEELEE